MIDVKKLDSKHFDFNIQINDIAMMEYHRDNGFTRISFKIYDPDRFTNKNTIKEKSINKAMEFFKLSNTTIPMITPTEGILNIIDLTTKNYLK